MSNAFIPALFATATGDDFIQPHHSGLLHESYCGDKNLITFKGDHNTARPRFFYDSASIFLYTTLRCEELLNDKTKFTPEQMETRKKEIREQKRVKREIEESKIQLQAKI